MKLSFLICLFLSYKAFAQSYIGFPSDNYSGVQGVLHNPANVADYKLKADINLIGLSVFESNSIYSANIFRLASDDFNFDKDVSKSYGPKSYAIGNVDVVGPSFLYSFKNESGIALFSRARTIVHASEINGNTIEKTSQKNNTTFITNNETINFGSQTWTEFGVSYGRKLLYKFEHYLKAGITIKYLKGFHLVSGFTNNLSVRYDFFNDENLNTTRTGGNLETVNIETLNKDAKINRVDGNGIGAEIGVIYEYRPTHEYENEQNSIKYKWKLGLSITDIGEINYSNVLVSNYNLNSSFTDAQYNINNDIETYYSKAISFKSIEYTLPTAMHFNFDYYYKDNYFFNFNSSINLVDTSQKNSIYIQNHFSLTPRYETKQLTFAIPFTYINKAGLHTGVNFRYSFFYIGSGSILSNIFVRTKVIDAYLGLKIPISYGKNKQPKECECF